MAQKATRNGFGNEMVVLGKENKNIFIVDADIGKSCRTDGFAHVYPEFRSS